eukprot:gene13173-3853_t
MSGFELAQMWADYESTKLSLQNFIAQNQETRNEIQTTVRSVTQELKVKKALLESYDTFPMICPLFTQSFGRPRSQAPPAKAAQAAESQEDKDKAAPPKPTKPR